MDLNIFSEIGILIGFAAVVSLLMRFLRQPLIVGHIITGFLVGQFAFGLFNNIETLELFSQLGISFLLFSVGLTLDPKALRNYGWVSILTGFGQVLLTGSIGVGIAMAMGYDLVTSLYVGVALAFSSTVIVMKLLSDKGDLDKLYVKLSIGSLLLQDLIAIVLLFAIPFVANSQGDVWDLLNLFLVGCAAAIGVFLFSHYVIKHLHRYLTQSQELIFLFTTAWGIGISALFASIGFSLEGGALIAGIALSTVPSRYEMGARLAPVKDFFIVTFFILLGTRMVVSDFSGILPPALIFSAFVLIGNPLLQLIIMGAMGYRRKTSFQTGMVAAQISEFSLILVALGVSLGQVGEEVLSMVTLVGLVTIFASSYLILYSDKIYAYLAPYLKIFERKDVHEQSPRVKKYSTLLIGGSRIGSDFISLFKNSKKGFIVVDHDPEVTALLAEKKVPHLYGDANDPDLLEDLKIHQMELVVSTVPDLDTNLILLSCAKRGAEPPVVIVVAHRITNALELYNAGADYVILPHFLGGAHAASLIKKYTKKASEIKVMRDLHIHELQSRADQGHEHPQIDRMRN